MFRRVVVVQRGFKSLKLLMFNIHYVICEVASKLNSFIILVLVSEFVVVAILSEWWSGTTIADYFGDITESGRLS